MELKDSKEKFIKSLDLTTREAYNFYREHRKSPSKAIDQYNYYVKAIRGLITTLEDMLVESEGGVYIDQLGYFCNLYLGTAIVDREMVGYKFSRQNRYVKVHKYTPYFKAHKDFEGWMMDRTFSQKYRLKLRESKINYKLNFDICEAYAISQEAQRVQKYNKEYIRKI